MILTMRVDFILIYWNPKTQHRLNHGWVSEKFKLTKKVSSINQCMLGDEKIIVRICAQHSQPIELIGLWNHMIMNQT